jgi:hypothetical protein
MKLSTVGEGEKSNKHIWYPTPLCFCINFHIGEGGLDLYPPPPPQAIVPPRPLWFGGRGTLAGKRGGAWESPISNEGTYTVVLFVYTYFVGTLDAGGYRIGMIFQTPGGLLNTFSWPKSPL